jgi:hypothetical protein
VRAAPRQAPQQLYVVRVVVEVGFDAAERVRPTTRVELLQQPPSCQVAVGRVVAVDDAVRSHEVGALRVGKGSHALAFRRRSSGRYRKRGERNGERERNV